MESISLNPFVFRASSLVADFKARNKLLDLNQKLLKQERKKERLSKRFLFINDTMISYLNSKSDYTSGSAHTLCP